MTSIFSKIPLLIIISSFSTLLPFFSGTVLLGYLKQKKYFLALWGFFVFAAATEIVYYTYHYLGKFNAWIMHIYTPIEYSIIAYVLALWQNEKRVAKFMLISIPAYILIFLVFKIFGLENFETNTINYLTRPLCLLLLVGFAFYTLHLLYLSTESYILKDLRLWMLLGIVIYYTGSIIVMAFMYLKISNLLIQLHYIHAVLNIFHNILFTVGIIVAFIYKSNPGEELAAV